MYLAAVIPGPNEPRLTKLNHYIRPVVNQFLNSWEQQAHFTHTANHPTGQDTCSAIAAVVCDLPAARKCNQSAGHSSHFFCTRCDCHHKSTLGRTDCKKFVYSRLYYPVPKSSTVEGCHIPKILRYALFSNWYPMD